MRCHGRLHVLRSPSIAAARAGLGADCGLAERSGEHQDDRRSNPTPIHVGTHYGPCQAVRSMRMSPETDLSWSRTARRSPRSAAGTGSGSVALPLSVEIWASTRIPAGRPILTSPEIERMVMSEPAHRPMRTSPLVDTIATSPSQGSIRRSPDVTVASSLPPMRRMVQSPETDETCASPSISPHESSPEAVVTSTRACVSHLDVAAYAVCTRTNPSRPTRRTSPDVELSSTSVPTGT